MGTNLPWRAPWPPGCQRFNVPAILSIPSLRSGQALSIPVSSSSAVLYFLCAGGTMQRTAARPASELRDALRSVDGRSYRAYHAILGDYVFPTFVLAVDHVQGDPFAAPSRLRVAVPQARAQFPPEYLRSHVRRVALADFITRQF